jgi:glucosylceramidase
MNAKCLSLLVANIVFLLPAFGSVTAACSSSQLGKDSFIESKTAVVYTTSLKGDKLKKTTSAIIEGSTNGSSVIAVNPNKAYQTMEGFGAAITYSTAYNLLKMSAKDRTAFLKQTFSEDSYGFSYVRISIGASDFSSTEYTCCDKKGIENFALQKDELDYVIPVLKEILAINPNLKIIGSPWTCPTMDESC